MTPMRSLRRMARRLGRAEHGASAVEFAFIVPIFLLFLLGVAEFARGLWVINTLQFGVAQGARYMMLPSLNGYTRPSSSDNTTNTINNFTNQVTTLMQTDLSNALLSTATATVTVDCTSCTSSLPTMTATITASYPFDFWLTALVPYDMTLQHTETVTIPLS